MPITETFESQDAAPEFLRDHLTERDGKWIFEGETAAEVANLVKTVKKERDGRTRYEKDLKRFKRFEPLAELLADADDDELDRLKESWAKRGDDPADSKGSATGHVNEKIHARELKKRDDAIATMTGQLETAQRELKDYRLWTPLRDIALKCGVIAEDWELVKLELGTQQRFGFDDDGKIVVYEDGEPSNVSAERYFREVYSEQRPKFYKASGAGGSGAQPGVRDGSPRTKTIKRDTWDKMAARERDVKIAAGFTIVD